MPSNVLSPQEVDELRALVADLSFPDQYQLERDATVPDGKGGRTATARTVEAGACRLRASGWQPNERVAADRLSWTVPLAVDLPPATAATPADRLVVNGRRLEVGAVIRLGAWSLVATAICQERG